ncbi:MAG: histidinol-phosphate transaminase [Actinobacteria bacterium]|nr:histidinol-phosphate transaminase [Actinomycetota bacterium]
MKDKLDKAILFREEIEDLKIYEPGRPISEVKSEFRLEEVIKLASNECPYPPFPETIEAIKEDISEANRYPDNGCFVLKEKLAEHLNVKTQNLVVGNGSSEILRLIALAALKPGDEAIIPHPSFIVYPTITKLMGGVERKVPLENYRHSLNEMLNRINDKTKIIFLCNPNNPTGTIFYKSEVENFLDKAPRNILVIFDEAYFEYVNDNRYPNGIDYLKNFKNVIVLRTFSKIYGLAGLRIGYGIASKKIIEAIEKVREPFNVNMLAQLAATVSLEYKDEVERRKKFNEEGKTYLYQQFESLGLEYVPTEANFILVDLKRDSRKTFEDLLKLGIIVRPGDIFGYNTHIRLTIGTPSENKKFIEGLQRVAGCRSQVTSRTGVSPVKKFQ